MKNILLLLLFYAFAPKTFCQGEKKDIEVHAEVVTVSPGIYELKITFDADTSLYAISLFQDPGDDQFFPIEIDFKEDQYLTPLGTWTEYPKAALYNHWTVGAALYIKKQTTYSHKFKLRKKTDFLSYCDLKYWPLNETKGGPIKIIRFEIRYGNNTLKVKSAPLVD